MHDDHLNGFPHLARRFGTRIWRYEIMLEILGEPIRVERSFRDWETPASTASGF
jgi:phosphoribosyl 1,2-cyclic phosphodiesterase